MVWARALSQVSPLLTTHRPMPASASRSVQRMLTYWVALSEWQTIRPVCAWPR